jgi:hypothetical protein
MPNPRGFFCLAMMTFLPASLGGHYFARLNFRLLTLDRARPLTDGLPLASERKGGGNGSAGSRPIKNYKSNREREACQKKVGGFHYQNAGTVSFGITPLDEVRTLSQSEPVILPRIFKNIVSTIS